MAGSSPFIAGVAEATLATFAMTVQTTGQVGGKNAGAPVSLTPVVAVILRADSSNAAEIYYGMGNAGEPLLAGEADAIDVPVGYYLDLSRLVISGTAGDVIHVVAVVVQGASGV